MKKNVFSTVLIVLTVFGISSCQTKEKKVEEKKVNKQEVIDTYKTEISALSDSVQYYMNWGVTSLNEGENYSQIDTVLNAKVEEFTVQLKTVETDLDATSAELKFTAGEYKSIFEGVEDDAECILGLHELYADKHKVASDGNYTLEEYESIAEGSLEMVENFTKKIDEMVQKSLAVR